MKKIAVYGKGGIGKSTIVSNIAAVLAREGHRVFQVGCDPKADSTRNLLNGKAVPSILETMRAKGGAVTLQDIVCEGAYGVLCAESGGPQPGVGCAGRGIIAAFEKLDALSAFDTYRPDVVLYDVLGDVVCGGFSMPLRAGYADEVYIVTSGEKMSLFAAENIAAAVQTFATRGYARLKGLIFNARNIPDERALVAAAAEKLNVPIIASIPRDPIIQECENRDTTVAEGAPASPLAEIFLGLSRKMLGADEANTAATA